MGRSLLKNCGISDCERGGCDDEARRPSISAGICKGGATTSARPPRHKMNCCSFSTGSDKADPTTDTRAGSVFQKWAGKGIASAVRRMARRKEGAYSREICDRRATKPAASPGCKTDWNIFKTRSEGSGVDEAQ